MQAATFTPLSATRDALWSAAVSACRAGIRAQGALAQDQISLLQHTLDGSLEQARTAAFPAPSMALQVRQVARLTDELLGITRIVADLQVCGATHALDWWQARLEELWMGAEAAPAAVTPGEPASAPTEAAPRRAPRTAGVRAKKRGPDTGEAQSKRARRKRRPD